MAMSIDHFHSITLELFIEFQGSVTTNDSGMFAVPLGIGTPAGFDGNTETLTYLQAVSVQNQKLACLPGSVASYLEEKARPPYHPPTVIAAVVMLMKKIF